MGEPDTEIRKLSLRSGDVLVFSCQGSFNSELFDRYRTHVREVLGLDVKILVLSNGMQLEGVISLVKEDSG